MFKRVADDPAAITRGWSELEEALGSLRGRKFYGAFDATIREYRVCVEIRKGDLPDELGLEQLPPVVQEVLRQAVRSSRRHSPFLRKRTGRMSHPTTRATGTATCLDRPEGRDSPF